MTMRAGLLHAPRRWFESLLLYSSSSINFQSSASASLTNQEMRNALYKGRSTVLCKNAGITSKNGRNDAKRLNINVVTVTNDDKMKKRKTQ